MASPLGKIGYHFGIGTTALLNVIGYAFHIDAGTHLECLKVRSCLVFCPSGPMAKTRTSPSNF